MIPKMGKSVITVLFILVLLLIPMITAEQVNLPTQQFNKIFLDPFYRQEMNPNTPYTYNINIDPPDKISEVKSAIITFQMWLNPTIEFFLTVNGESCNNPSYEVHTTYAGAGEGTIFFDCSNIINKAGDYEVILTPDDDTGAITGWIDLTYMNNPKGDLKVFGTEYRQGENGTIWLQLHDSNGNTVNNASCDLTVYYPDKTKWFDDVVMNYLEKGIFYQDIYISDNLSGVYMMSVFCEYEISEQEFQRPDNLEYNGNLKDNSLMSPSEVEDSDCTFGKTEAGSYQQFNFIDNGIGNINLSLVDELKIDWLGQNEKTATLQLYNWNTLTWDNLGASFINSKGTDGDCKNSHGVSRKITENFTDYIDSNELRVRIDMGIENKKLFTDNIGIHFHTLGETINDIRGSGEIHVNDWFNNYTQLISNEVWNWNNRTLTDYNSTAEINYTKITNNLWNYSGTVNSNILSQFTNNIWNYSGIIKVDILDQISNSMWQYTGIPLINLLNNISNNIWNYGTRDLTYYNMTDTTNYSRLNIDIPINVWNYTNRTLTDYNSTAEINYTKITNEVWNYTGKYTHGELI